MDMDMDMGHGHGHGTWDMGHGHGTWDMDMGHGHGYGTMVARACDPGHGVITREQRAQCLPGAPRVIAREHSTPAVPSWSARRSR